MKYLKLFESVKKFEIIGAREWNELRGFTIDLPEKELKEIQSVYPSVRISQAEFVISGDRITYSYLRIGYTRTTSGALNQDRSTLKSLIGFTHLMSVNPLPDEWYLVDSGFGIYYKCDQFDGLLDCLEFIIHDYTKLW